ncbi:MAG: restriction endonuclease subunit S [Anaerolinea sp.]|nr:restriction endonuclease subunit S [Anaerolinea sp.]
MNISFPLVPLNEIISPVERREVPITGIAYRQVGVRLWGQGAYERETIDGGQTQYTTLNRVELNDIIVNKIWARNGSVSIIRSETVGCYASGEFPLFVPRTDRLDPNWFYYLTRTPYFWKQCEEKSHGTSGKNRIRPERFLQIEIPLPPLDEQQRIVARIDALASRIAEARGLRQGAVEEGETIFKSRLRFAYNEALDFAGSLTDLSAICHQITDGTHNTPLYIEEGVPFLSVKDITSGMIDFSDARFISREDHELLTKRCRPEFGDILLTKVGTTGYAKAIDTVRDFSIFVSLALLKIDKSRVTPKFLEYLINSPQINALSKENTRGVGNKNLVLKFIRQFPIPVPSLDEQRRIVAYLDSLQAQVDQLKRLQAESAAELDALLPSILDRAFKGEL